MVNNKKEVIAYTHFHWDREWYKEFEKFRFRLLKSFDIVLDMLMTEKLPCFYFDGQTSALLDYLEIYPDKKSLIKDLVSEKRLYIGPFYCLIDEFLTSREVFSKNLEFGLKITEEFGCSDFLVYFADTFGHSACTIPILNKFGIDKAIVWRGCGDIPSEFTWKFRNHKLKAVNLIRGYFNDIFSTTLPIEKKIEFLKNNLDLISEKSGNTLLLPIGADHLGVPYDLSEQVTEINRHLDDYKIVLGSPFDYFKKVDDEFNKFSYEGELRDNSKTFILEGSYSSRPDIKKMNARATYRLSIADKLVRYLNNNSDFLDKYKRMDYKNLINYAYKLLLQNQAHDSICGCSTDDVHSENIIRYKKILQISESIIEDFRFNNKSGTLRVLNLGEVHCGRVEFESDKKYELQVLSDKNGFPQDILCDIYRIPITEDYTKIYRYGVILDKQDKDFSELKVLNASDVFVTEDGIGNSKVFARIKDEKLYIGNNKIRLIDFIDMGDSYNFGANANDRGNEAKITNTKVLYQSNLFCCLEIKYCLHLNSCKKNSDTVLQDDLKEIITLRLELGAYEDNIQIFVEWENKHINHLLQLSIDTNCEIKKTLSEDLNEIIEREFIKNYDVRRNLPKERGKEVKTNNAPMQRGVCANGVCVVTEGINQYEVCNKELRFPLLRATGVISRADNPSRTTPAGPPIEVKDLQQLGYNSQVLWIGFGNDLKNKIDKVYHECVIIE